MRGADGPRVGLCATCAHHRIVESRRGSVFYFCERSRTDDSYPRYPPLPVLACVGYRAMDPSPGRDEEAGTEG